MRRSALDSFACLKCRNGFRVSSTTSEDSATGEIAEGVLECTQCHATVPVVRHLPRFVSSESYAGNFGFQWNRFSTIQVDEVMHNDLSRDRFYKTTGWPTRMEGQRILEAGCGAGRFTQLALETGAEVFSFDLSSAVEAAWRNNSSAPKLTMFQASIYEIPLQQGSFDKIFCMGVLQHCPDVRAAFQSLLPFLRPGGEVVVDVYEKETGFPSLKRIVRPILTPLGTERIYKLLKFLIPPAFELKKALHQVPVIGPKVGKLIPIGPISHAPRLIYTDEELKQVKILSALDMYSPVYDQPQSMETMRQWFAEAGLAEVELKRGDNGIDAKGKRPNQSN
jgi:SAM-dependent methyltransferase